MGDKENVRDQGRGLRETMASEEQSRPQRFMGIVVPGPQRTARAHGKCSVRPKGYHCSGIW